MMGENLAAFFARLHSRRALILALTGVLAGFCLLVTTQLVLEENIGVMLPGDDFMTKNLLDAMARFPQANRLLVDVSSTNASIEQLTQAADDCYALLKKTPGLAGIDYRHDGDSLLPVMKLFIEKAPLLMTPEDLKQLELRLAPERLEKRLGWFKERMGTPQGFALKDVPLEDPVGVRDIILEKLRPMLLGFGLSPTDGRFVSQDGRHILMLLESDFPSSDSRRGVAFVRFVLDAAKKVETQHALVGARVSVAGAHRVGVDNAAMIRSDARRTVLLGIVIMAFVCLLAYRRPWPAFLTFLPTTFGVVFAGGVLAIADSRLSAIAVGCASMLVGIGVDYAVHVLYHLEDRAAAGGDRPAILARLTYPICIGLLTTIAAFLVMLGSSVPGHRQMGWFGCLTMVGSALFATLVLPLLVPDKRSANLVSQPPDAVADAGPLRLTRAVAFFFNWRKRNAPALLLVLAVAFAVAAFGWPRLMFDGDFTNLNGVFPNTRFDEEEIKQVWGDFTRLTLVVLKADEREQAWQKAEHVAEALGDPQNAGSPSALLSVTELCPSKSAQARNLAAWRNFWTPARRSRTAADLTAVAARLGYRPEPFAARAARLGHEPVEAGSLTPDDPALREWIAGRVSVKDDAAIVLAARVPRDEDISEFQRRVLAAMPDAVVLDNRLFAAHLADFTRSGLRLFAAVSTIAIAAVLFLFLGRATLVAAALLPLATGVGLTFGCLGWFGISLNLANIVFVIFLIGVGIDYSVFLVTNRLAQRGGAGDILPTAGASVFVCVLTTLAGFGALALARHPALWSIGWTALLGMICVLVSTFLLAPWLMDLLLRKKKLPVAPITGVGARRRAVCRLYGFQGMFVEQFVYWKLRTDPMFPFLDSIVPEQSLVLDLGCGYGLAANWLALGSASRKIIAVDFDEVKLSVARRACADPARVKFESGDIRAWNAPKADVVLLLDVLHYWQPDQQAEILSRARGLLRPGGKLALREGISGIHAAGQRVVAFWESFALATGHNRSGDDLHYPSMAELDSALRSAGFTSPIIRPGGGLGANRLFVSESLH